MNKCQSQLFFAWLTAIAFIGIACVYMHYYHVEKREHQQDKDTLWLLVNSQASKNAKCSENYYILQGRFSELNRITKQYEPDSTPY